MKRLILLCVTLLSGLSAAPRIDDPAQLLPADAAWAKALEAKLDRFEHSAGIRVLVQIHPKSPSEAEDKVAGAYMSALATKLGVIQHGVLIVYFADDPDWRMWVGDELTPAFVGKPGTAKAFTASGEMHEAKEAFFKAALAKADAAFAARPKGTPAQHIALQADALVDGLIAKLAPE